jgi:glycosyltransferase involved in cell wall biosynthesis
MNVGYVVSRYPLLSETFILREMWERERAGHQVFVYPLRRVTTGPRHERTRALRAPVWVAPWMQVGCHVRRLRRHPLRYCAALAAVVSGNLGDWNLLAGAIAYWNKAVAMAERMERDGIEVVHAHYATHPAMVAYVVERLTGIGYSFTAHAHDLYCHRAMLGEKLARARSAVTISEFNRVYLERARAAGKKATPIHVVRCGVEWERYEAMARERWQRWREAPPGTRLRVLAVGSLQPYKGHRHLLTACAKLRARGLRFECRLIGEGRLRPTLERQIAALDLAGEVRLLGARTEHEVWDWLRWADVFAMPSVVDESTQQMEGIPVALMEAMAAGLGVVATRLSGIPELVTSEQNGLLVSPGPTIAEELAAGVWRMRDAGVRERLARAARQTRGFDLATNVRRLEQVLGSDAGTEIASDGVAA